MNNSRKKDKDYSNLIIQFIILIFIIYFCITIYNQQEEIKHLNTTLKDVSYDYDEKKQELEKLQKQIKTINTLEFTEKQAREKLKMVKPNEKVYIDTNKSKEEEI